MNIKTLALSTVLSITGLVGISTGYAAPAEALTCDTESNGLTWCVQGTGNNRYTVTLQYRGETETLDIQCQGKRVYDWRSYGHLTQQQAETFVYKFCAL